MENKYRGKNFNSGWEIGSLLKIGKRRFIVPTDTKMVLIFRLEHIHWDDMIEVHPETVGQFIGSQDIHEIDIYDKDIVHKSKQFGVWSVTYGYFGEPCFKVHNHLNSGRNIETDNGDIYFSWNGIEKINIEIIGNEIDNPELIKG